MASFIWVWTNADSSNQRHSRKLYSELIVSIQWHKPAMFFLSVAFWHFIHSSFNFQLKNSVWKTLFYVQLFIIFTFYSPLCHILSRFPFCIAITFFSYGQARPILLLQITLIWQHLRGLLVGYKQAKDWGALYLVWSFLTMKML